MTDDDLIRRGELQRRVDLFCALMIGSGYADFADRARQMIGGIMRDIPSALPAYVHPAPVTVKPLEWVKSQYLKREYSDGYLAEQEDGETGDGAWGVSGRGKFLGWHPTLEAAKAAAQADYEACILSARPVADVQAEAAEKALREAAEAVSRAAWKHNGDDSYSAGLEDGARKQNEADRDAILALIKEPHHD